MGTKRKDVEGYQFKIKKLSSSVQVDSKDVQDAINFLFTDMKFAITCEKYKGSDLTIYLHTSLIIVIITFILYLVNAIYTELLLATSVVQFILEFPKLSKLSIPL